MELFLFILFSVLILTCAVFGLSSLFENYLSMPVAKFSQYIMNVLRHRTKKDI